MLDITMILATLFFVGVLFRALVITSRYLSHIDYADGQTWRTHAFVLIPCVTLLISGMLFAYDVYAWRERVPMFVPPVDRSLSLHKTALFFGIALTSSIVSWSLFQRRDRRFPFPNQFFVLVLSALVVGASLRSIYFSYVGYCCDTSAAVFAGFPFSILQGSYGTNYAFYDTLKSLTFLQIIDAYGNQLHWSVNLPAIFFNVLFWGNVIQLGFAFISVLVSQRKLAVQV